MGLGQEESGGEEEREAIMNGCGGAEGVNSASLSLCADVQKLDK